MSKDKTDTANAATADKAPVEKGPTKAEIKKAEKAAAAAAKAAAPKVPGIGDVAKDLIRNGKTNDEVLAGIKEAFPEANTTLASVNWYRNNLRQAGEKVPTSRELSAAAKPAKEPKEKKVRGKKAEAEAKTVAEAGAATAAHLQ